MFLRNEIKPLTDKKLHTQITSAYKLLFLHESFSTTRFSKSLNE